MSGPGHPQRTTVLVGVLLAVLLALGSAVVAHLGSRAPQRPPTGSGIVRPRSPSSPSTGSGSVPSSTPAPPRAGRGDPVRVLGPLRGRSAVVPGRGGTVLRYARVPHEGTRLHFICRGCDAGTWLVEVLRDVAVPGPGPLADPAELTAVVDVDQPGATTDLLVAAAPGSDWTVTLTPFSELPVHTAAFDALDHDVVAVRAGRGLDLTCGGALRYRTLARGPGEREYRVLEAGADDAPGTRAVSAGRGTDLLVLDVACPGRWSVAPH